jgi:hypothetical protein
MLWLRRVLCLLAGGVSFWALTTLFELLARREPTLVGGTLIPPCALGLAYLLARPRLRLRYAALWMLAGVFLLGPCFWMVGRTAFGGGFAHSVGYENARLLAEATLIPPVMLILAGYNGTLFGLLIAAILMPLAQWRSGRRRKSAENTHAAPWG